MWVKSFWPASFWPGSFWPPTVIQAVQESIREAVGGVRRHTLKRRKKKRVKIGEDWFEVDASLGLTDMELIALITALRSQA